VKVLSIVAARPNFIKLAGLHHALKKYRRIHHVIIHTGQHYDPLLSDVFFDELDVPEPDENLGVKSGDSNEETVESTRLAIIPVIKTMKPDLVIVYGDVSGALGGARSATDLSIPLAHVEAGLRSFDESMPEERNRRAIDHLCNLLFVTERSGLDNLRTENVAGNAYLVGNTMIDTLNRMQRAINKQPLPEHVPDRFGVVTMHRPSNVDGKPQLQRSIEFLNEIAESIPLVFPVHLRTAASMDRHGLKQRLSPRIQTLEPLGYLPFLRLLASTSFVLTDSGGIQEETTFLHKKCFTLRKNTERPATLEAGSNELINIENESDLYRVLAFASTPGSLRVTVPPLWDGKAGQRISRILSASLGVGTPPVSGQSAVDDS
jgi:UDP-N-acetylglucosamine 2-epimerase (non-hydrolysing)